MTKLRRMVRRIISFLSLFHLAALVLCSGAEENLQESVSISTRQKDITTPITTVPTTNNPSIPTTTNGPMLNPTDSNPEPLNPANPVMNPLSTNTPSSLTGSWCIASQSVSQTALQVALDYACGHGADCSTIQPDGGCYYPNTFHDHASYAFNSYYQKNPIPTSCNFGGTAVITNTDPSYDTCQYPSTSTSASVLNITNSIGSRVFGAGRPITPSTSAAATTSRVRYAYYILVSLCMIVASLLV